ncbi:MAG: hypothetical protein AAF550_02985 [Myxococcota bacterium]
MFVNALFWQELLLLTVGYALVDRLVRRDALLKTAWKLRLSGPMLAATLLIFCGVAAFVSGGSGDLKGYEFVPHPAGMRLITSSLTAMLTWKAVTRDRDIVCEPPRRWLKVCVLLAAAGTFLSPVFVFAALILLSGFFEVWQHHATMPMRVLQSLCAVFLIRLLAPQDFFAFESAGTVYFFLLTLLISHYWITGLAKSFLGPKWYSWALENRLDHLAASAYSWGWARFLPFSRWHTIIELVRRFRLPLQILVFAVELLAPIAMWSQELAITLCVVWATFHCGVFALSGLLFWEWIATDVIIAVALSSWSTETSGAFFGWEALLISAVFMLAFPMRHKLWKPMPLGWWDTPFTQRMHWRAHGVSGRVYGLYNNFMCPHERIYGKVHGCFLTKERVCTYHLGEVWKWQLRDALRKAGPDLEKLEYVRGEFGVMPCNDEMAERHRNYIQAFFSALNDGANKYALPRPLRWAKAPVGQCYYWGELPAYRIQEPVHKVSIHYREEYFDGQEIHRLRDECLEDIIIPSVPHQGRVQTTEDLREPTPKELDEYLLTHAAGRLIDIPRFAGGYVSGDDGKLNDRCIRPND